MPGWSGVERDLDLHRHRGGVAGRAGRGPVASPPSADQHCRKAHPAGGGASSAPQVSGWRLDQFLLWGRRSTGPAADTDTAAAARAGTGVCTGTAEAAGGQATRGTTATCCGTAETTCAGALRRTGVIRSRPPAGFGACAVETSRAGTIQAGKAEVEAEAEKKANGARPTNRPGPPAGWGSCGSDQAATR
ncbi:MAG: hypothetical protein QOG46_1496, partial [Pseudonocardiales bacterium]|nr:hypothetical protein [Pseudonocardiales bacterium]